jgi:hypothetical protein
MPRERCAGAETAHGWRGYQPVRRDHDLRRLVVDGRFIWGLVKFEAAEIDDFHEAS